MRIVIIGGGATGWLAARALSPLIGRAIQSVSVIETSAVGAQKRADPPVLIALPHTLGLLARLGVDEADLLTHGDASYHLGHAFTGWQGDDGTHFVPTAFVKAPIGPVSFVNLALRLIASGMPIRLSDFSLEALCAQTERFAPASLDPRSILSTLTHGLHIETASLVAWLRATAIGQGSVGIPTQISSIVRHANGDAGSILCANGQSVDGDLFLDCSGLTRIQSDQLTSPNAGEEASVVYEWASTARTQNNKASSLPLFAHNRANDHGWHFSVCTQKREHHLQATMRAHTGHEVLDDTTPWRGNCVALGDASAVLPPASGLACHMMVADVALLMSLLPGVTHSPFEAREYNRLSGVNLKLAKLWAALPLALNRRAGQPKWADAKAAATTPDVAQLIETWTKLGALNTGETSDLFEDQDWISLLWAFGARPDRYDRVADSFTIDAIKSHFDKIREIMLAAVATLPSHSDYLRTGTKP